MQTSINSSPWVQKAFFICFSLALLLAFRPFGMAIDMKAARDRMELVETLQKRLSNAVLSQAEEFRQDRWIRDQGRSFIRRSRHQNKSREFSPALAEKLGRRLVERFPKATVFAFDQTGKLVFQTENESKRSRELFWAGVLAYQRNHGGDSHDKKFQIADRFCKGLYGGLTTLSDLTNWNTLPQNFLNKGKNHYSWVFPQEILLPSNAASQPIGIGGIWLLIDPTTIPVRKIAEKALRHFPEKADTIMIVRKKNDHLRLERKIGNGRILKTTVERFYGGETEGKDRFGLWAARYIPGRSGSLLIAGADAKNLGGVFGTWGWIMKVGYFLVVFAAVSLAHRLFWMGSSSGLKLFLQVCILFGLVVIFPFVAVILQGIDHAREKAERSRYKWEQKIKSVLEGIDRRAPAFRDEQAKKLDAIETAFSKSLPISGGSGAELERLCRDLDKFEALVIDERGTRLNISRNLEKIQKKGEYPSYMARYLASLLEIEGKNPGPILANAPTLLSGHALENLLNLLFRGQETFERLRVRNNNYLQKKSVLTRPGTQPPMVQGLISWHFEETEFMIRFVEKVLAEAAKESGKFHPIQVGFSTPGGKFHPPELEASEKLRIMVERVERFQSSETGVVSFFNGKSYLATVLYPVRMGGALLIGMVETRETPEGIVDFEDFARILGFSECLPLERDRISALQILWLSILLSLLLMVPMAIVLSRWIVGRILTLERMVEEITRNHFEVRVPVPAADELGELAIAFNDMAGGLQERERMSRFVSDQVLEEVKKDDAESLALGGTKRDVAVLFTHIHSFYEALDRHPPETIIERLNEYFTRMSGPIKAHRGSIDKLIGDAIMAVFFPVPGEEHPAQRAIRAAQEMLREEARGLNLRRGPGEISFRTDIGVHYGQAISGKVGSRHGMIDFTVIGDTVNTAARIQSVAARQEVASILFSEEVLNSLPPDFPCRKLDQTSLKGKSKSIDLYKVKEDPAPEGAGH